MNTHTVPEGPMLGAFTGKSVSVADLAKATGAEAADVEVALEDWRQRQLVEVDDDASTPKTPRWRLTQLGRNQHDARFPA